ncbi:MAG: porphobilinogen synthase [Mucispirillum sp.]|nr:porphobilinogen synthase [Mucispirillum sp.]
MFPINRSRRLRKNETIRKMVRETALSVNDFIYPLFACEGKGVKREISSMPGVFNLSVDEIVREAKEVESLGIPSVIIFGIPDSKDEEGSSAFGKDGIVQKAVSAIKENTGLYVITDVCMCEFTNHGHCGKIIGNDVDNDATLDMLCREAVSHAEAGADMVAPSDMMDGRVAAIRSALDENGFENIPIMSYAVKFASAYYGPFREAADSAPSFGDRKSYQMDSANRRESLKEAFQDIDEGADIIMVKPALAYLDIIREVKDSCVVPVAAYNVSGEYSMIKAASRAGWIDEERVVMETLLSMKRAGSDLIITYFAKDAARILNNG